MNGSVIYQTAGLCPFLVELWILSDYTWRFIRLLTVPKPFASNQFACEHRDSYSGVIDSFLNADGSIASQGPCSYSHYPIRLSHVAWAHSAIWRFSSISRWMGCLIVWRALAISVRTVNGKLTCVLTRSWLLELSAPYFPYFWMCAVGMATFAEYRSVNSYSRFLAVYFISKKSNVFNAFRGYKSLGG